MIPDKQKIQIAIVSFLAGVMLAFIFYPKPEVEEVYKFTTKTETDTIFIKEIDTIQNTLNTSDDNVPYDLASSKLSLTLTQLSTVLPPFCLVPMRL